jgi:hypothetical protein
MCFFTALPCTNCVFMFLFSFSFWESDSVIPVRISISWLRTFTTGNTLFAFAMGPLCFLINVREGVGV